MNKEDKRLFLLDAYALIFRGYYAFIKNPRINSKGENTSAIFGFMNSLLEVIKKEQPTHLAVVFDVGRKTIRHEYFPEYKGTRDETPEPIRFAVPHIQSILQAMHIPVLFAEGYEADDVIGTLAKKAEKDDYKVYMMTPDKDFAQLVSENIFMYKPASRGGGVEILGIPEVQEKFGVEHPDQIIDLLGMTGDSVDNIPGLPGVGPKTAVKFLAEYGTLENLLANTANLKGKMKEKVEANKEQALLSKKLATILIDAPVEFEPDTLTIDTPDLEAIDTLFEELEFRRMKDNLYSTYNLSVASKPAGDTVQSSLFSPALEEPTTSRKKEEGKSIEHYDHFYQLVNGEQSRKLLLNNLLRQKEVCFDCETTGLNALEAELVGIAFSWESGKAYYLTIPADFEEARSIVQEFKAFFESKEIIKIAHNLKYDIKVLFKYDIVVAPPSFDTMVAHYLLKPDQRHAMDVLAGNYLGYTPISIEQLIGPKGKKQKSFREVPLEIQTEYAGEDADITFQLKQLFLKDLEDLNLKSLMFDLESPLVHVLADMEKNGIALDIDTLKTISAKQEQEIEELADKIFEFCGESFNLNSPKQLGEILFDKLKLVDKPKKTKTGQYATSEDILSKLAPKHKIVDDILEYRQIQKLKSTYTDALPDDVNPKTGRIHTRFGQTVAATGRLSSNNPNLQNIPIRTPRGREIRKAFVAKDENHVLLAADYSQIELRLIAQMSKEKAMIEAFQNGEDIHASTAAKLFKIPLDAVSREQRSQAKTVNFGIIYGVSAFGLSEQTGLSRSESKEMIDAYFDTYPMLQKYMKDQVEKARSKGFVETILGRRRYLPDIHSGNAVVRGQAERIAINAPVQGSAADIIKLAMIKIHKALKDYGTRMLLQVHDELVFEVPKHELTDVESMIKQFMENAHETDVPLIVETGTGQNWLDAH